MKKEYKGYATINGKERDILITQSRTRFELFVDERLMSQITKANYDDNVEKDVVIDGKVCQFVVYGEEPDVVVDGILQRADEQERKTALFHKSSLLILGMLQVILGTLGAFWWFLLSESGEEIIGGSLALVAAILFVITGIVEVIWGMKKSVRRQD